MEEQTPQDPPDLVEADPPKARGRPRQDPVLIIDKTGVYAQIDGDRHRLADHRALRGIALQCMIADLER